MHASEVAARWPEKAPDSWVLVVKQVTSATNARTVVPVLVPKTGLSFTLYMVMPEEERLGLSIAAVYGSYAFDFLARGSLAKSTLTFSMLEQLPVPTPPSFLQPTPWANECSVHDWTGTRVVGLSGSTTAMAVALGCEWPVERNHERREIWRTELDAALFYLYGYARDEVAYVMDTFPIVARKDRQTEGLAADDPNWRTKRLILAKYDELAEHTRAGTTYVSPDPPPPLPDRLRLMRSAAPPGLRDQTAATR